MLTVEIDRALELLAMPKRGRGGRTALRDLGTPEGDGETIQVFDGPYGLYVKQGKVNASLPEGTTAETVTIEQAIELLAAKKAAGGKTRKARGTAKSSTASKSAASKSTGRATKGAKTGGSAATPAKKKPPATTKTGRLRASAVRVIRPAGG